MSDVDRAVEVLALVFSRAEREFLNSFSRLSVDGSVGYGSAVIKAGSREYREGVLRYMGFLLKLMDMDYWERRLSLDVKKFVLSKG